MRLAVVLVVVALGGLAVLLAPGREKSDGPAREGSRGKIFLPPTSPPAPPPPPTVVYPMDRYVERRTAKWYGKEVRPAEASQYPCGEAFSGFHTGDDLEPLPGETAQELPVFAVAEGTVRRVGRVGGYGGLVVIEHRLDGQAVTAYYGHVDLGSVTKRVGEMVAAGEQLAVLGDHCSAETDFERRHLHFALRRGLTVDVRGYVQRKKEVTAWLDPHRTLSELGAQDPRGVGAGQRHD